MTHKKHLNNAKTSAEAGVYLPITAVVLLTVVSLIIFFGYRNVTLQRGKSGVQRLVDDVCYETSVGADPMLQKQLAARFASSLNNLMAHRDLYQLKAAKITSARLIAPTIGGFPGTTFEPRSAPTSFGSLGLPMCKLDQNSDCFFVGNPKEGSLTATFPDNVWNQTDDAGVTLGCEIKIELDPGFGGKREYVASAMETLPVRMLGGSRHDNGKARLSILVSPVMQTNALSSRFYFQYPNPSFKTDTGFAYSDLFKAMSDSFFASEGIPMRQTDFDNSFMPVYPPSSYGASGVAVSKNLGTASSPKRFLATVAQNNKTVTIFQGMITGPAPLWVPSRCVGLVAEYDYNISVANGFWTACTDLAGKTMVKFPLATDDEFLPFRGRSEGGAAGLVIEHDFQDVEFPKALRGFNYFAADSTICINDATAICRDECKASLTSDTPAVSGCADACPAACDLKCQVTDYDAITARCSNAISSMRSDLIVGCMNPAILVRNLFLQTILELSARHAQLQTNTEFLLLNPRHNKAAQLQMRNRPTLFFKPLSGGNFPLHFDFINQNFLRLPQLTYRVREPLAYEISQDESTTNIFADTGAISFADLAYRLSPWINTFTSSSLSDPNVNTRISNLAGIARDSGDYATALKYSLAQDALHKLSEQEVLVANQLRNCQHLYRGSSLRGNVTLNNGLIDKIPAIGVAHWNPTTAGNFLAADKNPNVLSWPNLDFEEPKMFDVANDDRLSPALRNTSTEWGGSLDDSDPVQLSGIEVAGMLGSVQDVPATWERPTAWTHPWWRLNKPTLDHELSPEIISGLWYLHKSADNADYGVYGGDGSWSSYTRNNLFPFYFAQDASNPYNPPPIAAAVGGGVFPTAQENSPLSMSSPFGPAGGTHLLSTTGSQDSHVLIVLHRPPHPQDISEIHQIVKQMYIAGREMTVVYIPTNDTDASEAAIGDLTYAFSSETGVDHGQTLMFAPPIIVFSPYVENSPLADNDRRFGPAYIKPSASADKLSEDQQFSNYWNYLLDFENNKEGNIVSEAKQLFRMRILTRNKRL